MSLQVGSLAGWRAVGDGLAAEALLELLRGVARSTRCEVGHLPYLSLLCDNGTSAVSPEEAVVPFFRGCV